MTMNSNVARKLSDRILIDSTKTMDLVAQSMMRDIAKEVAEMEFKMDEAYEELHDRRMAMWCDFDNEWISSIS
jgi:hypothetical protein